MRMNMHTPLSDERGVAGLMVVIVIAVIIGMLAFAVDGGALFLKRRAIVNANDAAALAAALTCARGQGAAAADGSADQLAVANVANATQAAAPLYTPSCTASGGKVTVHFQATQGLFFSQVVGVTGPKVVSTTATATWGGAGSDAGVMPFMLDWGRLNGCSFVFPPGPPVGTKCPFWFNSKDVGNAEWGQLNLTQWDCSHVACGTCTGGSTNQVETWLAGGAGTLALNYPNPTYVCAGSGFATAQYFGNCGGLLKPMVCYVGQQFAFPVNDDCTPGAFDPALTQPQGQATNSFALACPPSTPYYYDIVGFAQMELTALYKGNDPLAAQAGPNGCGSIPAFTPSANAICLIATWKGYSTSNTGDPGGGHNFGVVTVGLSG
jgi:Flp pilus assembly protein TadG